MKNRKLTIIFFAAAFMGFFLSGVLAQEAKEVVLTLDQALALSLRANHDILLKAQDVEKAELKIDEAKAALFPSLDFTVNRLLTAGLYAKDIPSTSTQTTLKQYLYTGGKTTGSIKENEYKLIVAQALLDKTKLGILADVKKAFYTLSLADELVKINKGILDNSRVHLSSLESRYQQGQASSADVAKVKASLADLEQAYGVSLNQVNLAQELLKNLLYIDSAVLVKPKMELVYEPIEVAYDEAFLKALRNRPEVKQYQAQEEADKKGIEVAKADNRPSVYASWDYYSRSTTSLSFSPGKGWQDYNILGITFSWPIFDGFATQSKISQAIVDLKQSQTNKEKMNKDIALEVKNAYIGLMDAILKIKSNVAQVDLYNNSLEEAKEKYKAGIFSSLDLDDARLRYDIACFNQNQSTYDYLLAKSKFDAALGEGIK